MLSMLAAAAATASIFAALIGAGKFVVATWHKTIGLRRSQTKLLDQLACGVSARFIDELLGTPKFVHRRELTDERLYRLPGAWVAVDILEDSVIAFTITITEQQLRYSTENLTFGNTQLTLGRSRFGEVSSELISRRSGQRRWIGARRYGYIQHFYFGNPGGYQHYWLSFNQCGYGIWDNFEGAYEYADGTYGESSDNAPNVAMLTINSLTVLGPRCPPTLLDDFMAREVLGADEDIVRLDVSFGRSRRPSRRRMRNYLKRMIARLVSKN